MTTLFLLIEHSYSEYDSSTSYEIIGLYDNKPLAEFMIKNEDQYVKEIELTKAEDIIKKIKEFDKLD